MQRRLFLSGCAATFLASRASSGVGSPLPAITTYEAVSGGHAGVYAHNLRTGVRLTWRATERFVMCSTFKASLAGLVLARVDQGHEQLDRQIPFSQTDVPDWWAPVAKANLARGTLSVSEMCQAIVEQSDNTCANLLLDSVGGPAALTAFWRTMEDRHTRLDDTEPLLNVSPPDGLRNTTTPAAMASILRHLLLGQVLSEKARGRLRDWMIGCKTGADRLRAGLPADWVIADKTGNNGTDAAGDIALVWPRPEEAIVICVYTRGGAPTPLQTRDLFAGIARSVTTKLA